MSGAGAGQDWETVSFSRRGRGTAASKAGVAKAMREGTAVSEKRWAAGENKSALADAGHSMRKLEDDSESMSHAKVGLSLGKAIQQARAAKGMKQKELATKINVRHTIIADYERGTAIPNNHLIANMERALGVKLPRPSKKRKPRA